MIILFPNAQRRVLVLHFGGPGVGTCSLDTVFFNVSQEVAMLFRVARVALCHIPYVSEGMCVRNRRGTKVAVSTEEAELHTVHSTHYT